MGLLMDFLGEEHRRLLEGVETLKNAADALTPAPAAELQPAMDRARNFLFEQLIPFNHAEERAMITAIAQNEGPMAAALDVEQHVDMAILADRFSALSRRVSAGRIGEEDAMELRRVLYAAYETVRAHLVSEEQILVPALEARLSASAIAEVVAALQTSPPTGNTANAQVAV
jgi:Hemerythrin HHE cation binding domain